MEQIALRIGDRIRGKVLNQIHSGCAGDEYFSIENVLLDTGLTIRIFFMERGAIWRPEFGEEFTGTIDHCMTGDEPFTTKSSFLLTKMAPYREPATVDETVFHIEDTIRGQIVRTIDTGTFLGTYFSIEEVLLDTGQKIAVGFYEGQTWRPSQNRKFVATVAGSTFSIEPYTLKSCIQLKNVTSEPELVQSIAESAPIRRSPIARLGEVCRKAFRYET